MTIVESGISKFDGLFVKDRKITYTDLKNTNGLYSFANRSIMLMFLLFFS